VIPRAVFTPWLLAIAVLLAATLAFAGDPSNSAPPSSSMNVPRPVPQPVTAPSVAPSPASSFASGLAPLPNDRRVPPEWLPPGAGNDDMGPSDVIFPPQSLTVRFNHTFHVRNPNGPRLTCATCHKGALTSESAADGLLPSPTLCDACHGTDHTNANKVLAGDEGMGKCAFCHVGYKDGDGNAVARLTLPRPNMVFNHKKHAARNIGCGQCHGEVAELELATRDQMPRMRGRVGCHQMNDAAARGTARSDCLTCHLPTGAGPSSQALGAPARGDGGRMRTLFATGQLYPPRWLHNAAHTPDWIERHKTVAGADSQFCANCHKEDFCVECHDGRVRPRSIHPNDFLSMHPIEARQGTERCTSCHREQSFCLSCHQRLGITMSGPTDVRMSSRFHPPKEVWSDAPRRPGHHSFEAERNINACVSCHIERDCVVCHGAQGIGGGFDPHRAGFVAGCAVQFRRNPRPCYVCHEQGDRELSQCR
jgi:hypothetical protein